MIREPKPLRVGACTGGPPVSVQRSLSCPSASCDQLRSTFPPAADNEPYLAAFHDPKAFFPLLLTGKLTMAEVYWRTTPVASWMISFIGDPLYTPYRVHPALDFKDLPIDLQAALQPLN